MGLRRLQDLGEALAGPTAAWQLGVQGRMPGGQDRRGLAAQGIATPDGLGNAVGQWDGRWRKEHVGLFDNCLFIQYRT